MREPVVVVGGGPAGLAAAIELRCRGAPDVVVLEREEQAGGIPRHAAHQGFGARDLRRLMSGPAYARRYADRARAAGARLRTEAMATGWTPDGALEVTSPAGRETLEPAAVVLATGCRERARAARLVPGSRPAGVMTTGTLQQVVHLRGERAVGERVVVVGAEHVSFSAVATLAEGGARAVAIVTEAPRHQSFAAFAAGARARYGAPLHTRTAVTRIDGRERVEAVELTDVDSGATRLVECDTVVFTADWIPDHELAVAAGIDLDPGTRGPVVDAALRTSRAGVFAAGNLDHGAEAADVAAIAGRHAGAATARFLGARGWPERRAPIRCAPPLQWIAPNAIAAGAGAPPRGRFLLRAGAFLVAARIEIRQDGRALWAGRVPRLQPGRSTALPAAWAHAADPAGGPVEVRVARARLAAPMHE